MSTARRTQLVEYLVTNLKNINGEVSTYNNGYIYQTNLFNNVERRLVFLDEVNDFPSLYVSAGTEFREFHSQDLTVATLEVIIRGYIYSEDNSQKLSDDLIQDVEHVIYGIADNPDIGLQDIKIESITVDEGLASPYGIAEVELSIVYRLQN